MSNLAPPGTDWTEHEREHVSRLETLCRNVSDGELECSRTNAGDRWCMVYDQKRLRVVLHIARIERHCIVVWPGLGRSVKTDTMVAAVNMAIAGLSRMPERGGGNVRAARGAGDS
jgi:hypothetical protein